MEFEDYVKMEIHASYECDMNSESKIECRFCHEKFTKKYFVEAHVRDCNDLVNLIKSHSTDRE